jgi:uncharacterized protein YneF (UPF0154 family)
LRRHDARVGLASLGLIAGYAGGNFFSRRHDARVGLASLGLIAGYSGGNFFSRARWRGSLRFARARARVQTGAR